MAAVAIAAVGAVWMLLPAMQERGGVAVIADREGAVPAPDTVSQLRQSGRAADVLAISDDPCLPFESADFDAVGRATDFVVISLADVAQCTDEPIVQAVDVVRAADLTPVVVRFPGTEVGDVDAIVVDTEVLLGPPGEIERPCEWWDRVDPFGAEQEFACSDNDMVVVRFADGGLTTAGTQRVARMVAAAIG